LSLLAVADAVGVQVEVGVTLLVDVLVDVEVWVKVAVAKAIVMVAPVEGNPVKLTACPFVPDPPVTLNW